LIRDGKSAAAEKFANAHFHGPARYDASDQTPGDLNFEFQLPGGAAQSFRKWGGFDQRVAVRCRFADDLVILF
jgi:hypothetical protein